MGKIIFWLVVAFVVLLIVRLISMRNTLRMRASEERKPRAAAASELTVRCLACGVFIPRADARPVEGGFRCADPQCRQR